LKRAQPYRAPQHCPSTYNPVSNYCPEKTMHTCPDCGSDFTRRIARTWWMRALFKNSQHIHCSRCDQRSLVRGTPSPALERPLRRNPAAARRAI
jgi:DNA-directed RNA polymerase subunit RPC12/RpoP